MPSKDLRDKLEAALGDAYHIERELTPGGMSRLFLATERSLDRQVVIKLLPPEYASEVSAARFQREVTLTAHLQHPHILPILTAGSKDGLLYYVMPYVAGESLRQRLDREGSLPIAAAVQVLREIADALARAHKAGIVHRDIKPENILMEEDHALLADFGVARALHEATAGQRLTDTGAGLGTPEYMAPEQLAGERNVDRRADVYALAVVGYEMLAGAPPFVGATPQAVAAAHFTSAPKPLADLRPAVPPAVSWAIGKALANEPAQRFATAAEFRDALVGATPDHQPSPPIRAWSVRAAIGALLLLAGVTFAWRSWHSKGSAITSGPVRLAVLPFENLGDSTDAYFVDGLTDAVRGKLTALPALAIIAPTSSAHYRHSTKTLQQIGQELGVRYLLTGTVRWSKAGGAAQRVQVTPALVEVANATDKWEQPFDAPLTDVFQVQDQIARRVAEASGVALGSSQHAALSGRPTQNLAAYDAYLRGQAFSHELAALDITSLQRAVAAYTEAITLDSNFALAWAALARAHSHLYLFGVGPAAAIQRASERALTLEPTLPEAHLAQAEVSMLLHRDYARAVDAAAAGRRLAPSNAALVTALGQAERALGHWNDAVSHLQEAAQLDPEAAAAQEQLGITYLWLRRYPDARAALDRALALDPTNVSSIQHRMMVSLAAGDLTGARAVFYGVPPAVDRAELLAFLTNLYDLYWVLDDADQRRVLALTPAAFGNRGDWALTLAEVYSAHGDSQKTRIYADSARLTYADSLRAVPDDPVVLGAFGWALAYLGRREAALREGNRVLALSPYSRDAYSAAYWQHPVVNIYVILGEHDKAIDLLETMLKAPGYLSPAWLRMDPHYAPLRGNPRFERLIAQPTTGERPTA